MKKIYFVTGTSTDIGKTVISAILLHQLKLQDLNFCYFKPIQTGGIDVDLNEIKKLLSYDIPYIPSVKQFDKPLSPDQAVLFEVKPEARIHDVILAINESPFTHIVMEGAGGLLVPINSQRENWLDVLRQINCEIILVSKDVLGTLNHTSLTIDRLDLEGFQISHVILNEYQNELNLKSLQNIYPEISFNTLKKISVFEPNTLTQIAHDMFSNLCIELKQEVNYLELDKEFIWHPYTQHKTSNTPLLATSTKNATINFDRTCSKIDGTSSWWVNTIGHSRPEIAKAIYQQQQTLDHVIFAGITHKPAIDLAKKLVELTNGHLQKVFFSDNGSTAIEIALKMAYQSFANQGQTRTKFLGFHGSYHGDTFGTMSVAKSDGFHQIFEPLMFKSIWARPLTTHPSYLCPNGIDDRELVYQELSDLFATHHNELAAVIIEPLIQGAGGMLMNCPMFLKYLENLCKKYKIPLIFDEVFTAMGRVGDYFAFLKANIDPDIVCIAKGLTGGNLPLALTLAKQYFYDAFLSDDKSKALLHGHSYTGNAIACAAAIETLKIVKKDQLIEKAIEIESCFIRWIFEKASILKINNPRCLGAILAFELPNSGFSDYYSKSSEIFLTKVRERGLYLRALGNTIYFVPPLTISPQELANCLEIINISIS